MMWITVLSMMITSMSFILPNIRMIRALSTYFMKLYSIVRVVFLSIKSNICEIIPNREECRIHQIWEKKLIKHKNNSKWNYIILVTHYETIVPRLSYNFLIGRSITKPCKDISYLKYITLFCHINNHSRKSKNEKSSHKHIENCIKNWLCWLTNNKSSMKRKKNSKNKNKVYWNTNEKYRKTKRKESSSSTKGRIPYENDWKKNIYSETNNTPKGCLKYLMKWNKIIKDEGHKKNSSKKGNIKLCHLECLCKRCKKRHEVKKLWIMEIVCNVKPKARKSCIFSYPFILSPARYAIARASAASSGFGISESLSIICNAFCTCGFLANQFPAIPCFTWSGVNSMIGIPWLASIWSTTPLAWATSIPFVTFRKKKSLSTPHTVGW